VPETNVPMPKTVLVLCRFSEAVYRAQGIPQKGSGEFRKQPEGDECQLR
jgi:hypothetical protein